MRTKKSPESAVLCLTQQEAPFCEVSHKNHGSKGAQMTLSLFEARLGGLQASSDDHGSVWVLITFPWRQFSFSQYAV